MASGFTQYTHWCKESAITVSSLKNTKQQDKPCPICSTKEKGLKDQKKNCCQYDTKIVKVDDSVKKQNSFDFSVKFLEFTLSNKTLGTVYDAEILALANKNNNTFTSSKIPFKGKPLHILHCVYRI